MREPRLRRGLVAVAMVLAVLALASIASSSAWATPAQDALRQTVPTPRAPTPEPPPQSIVLPPQPGRDDYSFVYVPLPPVDDPPPPAGCEIYNPFRIEAYLGTELAYPENFDPPLEICVSYTADQAAEAGGADNLSVVYLDEETQQWIPLDNRRHDPDLSQVCGDIAFVSANNVFAITCVVSPTAVPVTGHGPDSGGLLVALALVGTLATAGMLAVRRREAKAD